MSSELEAFPPQLGGVPQFLMTADGNRLVVLAEGDYEALLQAARRGLAAYEPAIEAVKVLARLEEDGEESAPFDVLEDIAAGENAVKAFREWRGVTQATLAERAETSAAYISQIETNVAKPSIGMLYKIAAALDISPEHLTRRRKRSHRRTIADLVRLVTNGEPKGTEAEIAIAFLDSAWTDGLRSQNSGYGVAKMAADNFSRFGNMINYRIATRHFRNFIKAKFAVASELEG